MPHFSLRSDERSSSDQSCDTVIQLDSEGLVQSRATSRLAQPEFVPIIPSLHPNKADMEDPEFAALLQELLRIPQLQGERKDKENLQGNIEVPKTGVKGRECLKCDTFAELQERLGCIDGSEATMEALKSASKGPPANSAAGESQPVKEKGRQTSSEAPQTSLSQGVGCSQASVSEKLTDGAFPGDAFQREDSGLYDCEECSTNSSGEELLNQTLHRTCRSEGHKHESARSNSQKLDANSQGGSLAKQNAARKESPEAADWFKADKRTSPVGKSSPISPSSSSCSASHSTATGILLQDALTNRPREVLEEMKATITVTVQQPLDLKGQDELVFSMVEEVTISGALKRGRAGGNVICIRDGVQSLEHVQGSGSSQPIRIISNVGDDAVPAGWSDSAKRCTVQAQAPETKAQPQHPPRKEKRYLPSFINPVLMNTDVEVELEEPEEEASFPDSLPPQTGLGGIHVNSREDRKVPEERIGRAEKPEVPESSLSQTSHDSVTLGDLRCRDKSAEKACGKRPRGTDRGHPGERGPAFPSMPPRISEEAEIWSRRGRSDPRGTGLPPGCQETSYASIRTGSLPRLWHKANHQDTSRGGYTADAHRDLRGVTSSTPCSPDVTLKRRQRMQHAAANHSVLVSKQHVNGKLSRQSVETLCQSSSLRGAKVSGRLKSPTEDRLFNVRLEQPATRSNSLGRTPRDFPTLGRDSSSTSMSSKGSSKESTEGAFSRGFKGLKEGDYTSPRATRSPRKNRSEQSYHFFPFDEAVAQPASRAHPKLSAVGKLKMACGPKVRRLSAPSFRSLSLTRKSLQPVDRSESPSPDSKCVSFERTSSFLSSSPPRSFRSISRTPSQSSTCSSTKSAIQGFVNGRISDLLKERPVSPVSAGLDPMGALPSPYSRVTSPRVPDRSSGHASDTTSVLSGDLPPAMGKTSLYFSGRSSMVSSGYDSTVKDGEVGGSGTSACYSSSDRSGSLLSVARSSRSSRRRGHTGKTPGRNGLL